MKWRAWLAWFALIATSAGSNAALADNALISWTPPTTHTDGTPLTDLSGYRLLSGCVTPGQYERPSLTLGVVTSYDLGGLPSTGTCYFALQSLDSTGDLSAYSNEASKFMGLLAPPSAPTSGPVITWARTSVAVAYVQNVFSTTDADGSNNIAITINGVAAGSAIIVEAFWKANVTITSVTDDKGGTYGDCGAGRLTRPTDGFLQILGAPNAAGGNTVVTIHFSGAPTAGNNRNHVVEYSGAATSSLFDSISSTGTATSGTHVVTGSFTPTITSGAILGVVNFDTTTSTGDSGYTVRHDSGSGSAIIDQIFTGSVGTLTAGITAGSAVSKAGIVAAVIKVASGGAAFNPTPIVDYYAKLIAQRAF